MMDGAICGLRERTGRQVWMCNNENRSLWMGGLLGEVGAMLQWGH